VPGSVPFVNALDYGATGDGHTDDAPAIMAAIAAAGPGGAPTGNTVYLPAGRYLLGSGLSLPPAVTLQGSGWNTPGGQANTFAGSWLFTAAGAPFSPVTIAGSGAAVRNLAFNVPDQSTTGAPAPGQPMVHVTANNALVEDVCLYNPYVGIYIDGAAQATIRRTWGQPVQYGIVIDRSTDTNYIEAVHFWPYWQPVGHPPADYQRANGTAICLFRCDNPFLSNIFALNYARGLSLAGSPAGTPHKVHLANADFDGCVTGVHIGAPGQAGSAATLQMANVTIQSPGGPGAPAGHGLWVANSGLNAIRIDADNAMFYGDNVLVENWRGDAGIHVASPSSYVHLGAGFNYVGNGPPLTPQSQFRIARLA